MARLVGSLQADSHWRIVGGDTASSHDVGFYYRIRSYSEIAVRRHRPLPSDGFRRLAALDFLFDGAY